MEQSAKKTVKKRDEQIICSVIIRTKDRPRHLCRSLESVREQKRKPDEVIVVNDGGESITSIIDAFNDLPIIMIVNKISQGRSVAGNIGAEAASGDAISFLDDDDRFFPDHLKRLELAMLKFDAKVAYSGSRLVLKDILGENEPEQTKIIGEFNDPFDQDRLVFENYIPLNTLLINRRIFIEVGGFDPTFNLFEDWDMIFRLSRKTKFYHLNRVTSEYAIWGKANQITLLSRTENWRDAYCQIFTKNFLNFPDIEKVKRMADYWLLSQERRSKIQELESKLDYYSRENSVITNRFHSEIEGLQNKIINLSDHNQSLQNLLETEKKEFEKELYKLKNSYNKRLNIIKSALKRQKVKKEFLYQTINEQNREIALSVANNSIRSILIKHKSEIDSLSFNVIKANYNRLAKWIKLNTDFSNSNIDLYSKYIDEQIYLIQSEIDTLQQMTKSLLNQLNCSKLKKIWRGIPIPQVSSILEKNIKISQLLSDVSLFNSNMKTTDHFNSSRDKQLTFISKTSYRADLIQDIIDYIPIFEAFIGNEEKSELMLRVNLPAIATTPIPLKNNNRLSFSIYSTANNFFCLSIMFATYIRINTCDITVSIFENRDQNIFEGSEHKKQNQQLIEPLRRCEFNAIELLDNQYHTVVFDPILDSKGKIYKIEIASPNATDDQHIAVWCYFAKSLMLSRGYSFDENQNEIILSKSLLGWDINVDNTSYPLWMKKLFTGLPFLNLFPNILRPYDDNIKNIFCIYSIPQDFMSGILPLVLLQLVQMAQEKGESISVIVYGKRDSVTEAYCDKNSIEYVILEKDIIEQNQIVPYMLEFLFSRVSQFNKSNQVNNVTTIDQANQIDTANQIDSIGLIWFFQSGLIPAKDIIENVEQHFQYYRDTGILLPLIQTNDSKIAHAFGQMTREGSINTFIVDGDVTHPSNRYVREVDAADAPFFVISSVVMGNIDITNQILKNEGGDRLDNGLYNHIVGYKSICYQMSEFIWQLKERGFTARFDPTVVFTGTKFKDDVSYELLDNDRLMFLKTWKSKIFNKPAVYDERCKLLNPDKKITALVVDITLPTFDEDSGSLRMYELLRLFAEIGIKVTFFPDNLDSKPKYRVALERLGIEVFCGNYGIADALDSRKYDIIILSRVAIGYHYMNLVKLLNPNAKIYYDTVDIHYIREFRQADIENSEKIRQNAIKTRQKELANCIMADIVFTVTEEDKKHLQKEIPSLNCFVLPNIHRNLPFNISWENTDGLVFIGNYNHQPNEDAVFYFVENVFPKVLINIPEIKLYLIGSYMRDKMKALESEHIKIIGWVEKVEPELIKRRVMVSYLRYGAGMKGKIGQAMSLGLPVVSTSIGAEGIGLKDGETIMVADDSDSFADKICRIYKDRALWKTISENSKHYIYSQYGTEAVKNKLKAFLSSELEL